MADSFDSDPKYRKYTQQVEKCLNSFDNVHEWADCITFLKQLLKTLQTYTQFKEIPRKLIVAKRLAQCLNPALPAGVHQRALDVYGHILAVQGSEGLSRDLALWSSGLLPFFAYAATSVKPTLLSFYDTHYLSLGSALRPIMKAFILALLPGLEEETGEFFDKVLTLLDRLSETVSQAFFFQNIWLIMLTTPSARETCLNFLSRRLPKLNPNEDATHIVGRDIGLMIRAFAAALEDENLLVRRGALDLLLLALRLDSSTFQKAQAHDQSMLMRAATCVVLRRDLTLNRRLYKWLHGPSEKSDDQTAYYRQYSLSLLTSTLKEEMLHPSKEYSESRPFKVFISLLDKWEIGAPLTDSIICDCLHAIKQLVEKQTNSGEDMILTANTLYEAVEPTILWRQILSAIFADVKKGSSETLLLATFMIQNFSSHDEEVQAVHLPIVFTALLDLINGRRELLKPTDCIVNILVFLIELFPHISKESLTKLPASSEVVDVTQTPYAFACTFYGIPADLELDSRGGSVDVPLAHSFECLLQLSQYCAEHLASDAPTVPIGQDVFFHLLALLSQIAESRVRIAVKYAPSEWLNTVLSYLNRKGTGFATFDRTFTLLLVLHKSETITPRISIHDRSTIQQLVNKLLSYLLPQYSCYHLRAVGLLIDLESICKQRHVEAIICQGMTSSDNQKKEDTFEAFSVLWRLTEDNLLPGFRFHLPMMIILETLSSQDPHLRRIGETWMRSSLRSYLRILDPIVFNLLDPGIRRAAAVTSIRGRELPGFSYEAPFDQRYIHHILDVLSAVVQYGGLGIARTLRTATIRRTNHQGLAQRVVSFMTSDAEWTYLEVLVQLLLRFFVSEPIQRYTDDMRPTNVLIQTASIDILQAIVSRGEIGPELVSDIEVAIIGKLYAFVHTGRLDLQNKVLHLVHSAISASISSEMANQDRLTDSAEDGTSRQQSRLITLNPLLAQTLMDGITIPSNRPILQHWLDFVLMAVPQFQPSLHPLILPLTECVCRQLKLALADLRQAVRGKASKDTTSTVTDSELIMLLTALERLVSWGTATNPESTVNDDDVSLAEKGAETGGLFGIVSNVFGSDNAVSNSVDEQATAWSSGFRSLQDGVDVLFSIWSTVTSPPPKSSSSKYESFSYIYSRTANRCRRALEHLFRVHPVPVLESIIKCWKTENATSGDPVAPLSAFELIDVLAANAHHAVHIICESISSRLSSPLEKRPRPTNPELTDSMLFQFLERYLERLEGPVATQVWSRYMQLTKEVIASKDARLRAFPALRCFSVLASKLTNTTSLDDKKIRKDLQETFTKLLDICLLFVGRSFDQGSWIRRGTKDSALNGRDSPAPKLDEKAETNTPATTEPPRLDGNAEVLSQIHLFLAASVIPNLRKFLVDTDKVASAASNIVYYAVSPSMKDKVKPIEADERTLGIMQELSRISAALKAWKPAVTELFYDNRFFNGHPALALKWKPVFRALLDCDKTSFAEILSKVTTAPSNNIFVSKDYEMLVRSLSLRRLSFAIFAGDKNQFLTQLPLIQEKLVDTFRNVSAPIVQSEVYICIRVLLCRFSPHSMMGFWPTILTELYRVFEKVKVEVPPDGSEDLQLVLAASKCLDLLVSLQTEEFQIHQWMFITDTVDAIYRPDDWTPSALVDQLAEVVNSLPSQVTGPNETPGPGATMFATSERPMRKPMLNSMRAVDSIRSLIPFFSSVSISSYESVYASNGTVDWEAVETGLIQDMFDGQ